MATKSISRLTTAARKKAEEEAKRAAEEAKRKAQAAAAAQKTKNVAVATAKQAVTSAAKAAAPSVQKASQAAPVRATEKKKILNTGATGTQGKARQSVTKAAAEAVKRSIEAAGAEDGNGRRTRVKYVSQRRTGAAKDLTQEAKRQITDAAAKSRRAGLEANYTALGNRFAADWSARQKVRTSDFQYTRKQQEKDAERLKNPSLDREREISRAYLRSGIVAPLDLAKADSYTGRNPARTAPRLSEAQKAQAAARRKQAEITEQSYASVPLSDADRKLPENDQRAIGRERRAWEKASAAGDLQGMTRAHTAAEAIRRSHGYTGGKSGDEYYSPALSLEDRLRLNKKGETALKRAKLGYELAVAPNQKRRAAARGEAIRNAEGYRSYYSKRAEREAERDAERRRILATGEGPVDAHGRPMPGDNGDAWRSYARVEAAGYGAAGGLVKAAEAVANAARNNRYERMRGEWERMAAKIPEYQGQLRAYYELEAQGYKPSANKDVLYRQLQAANYAKEQLDRISLDPRSDWFDPTQAQLRGLPDTAPESLGERWIRTGQEQRDLAAQGLGKIGTFLTDTAISGYQMLPSIAATALIPGAGAAAGAALMGGQAMGQKAYEVGQNGGYSSGEVLARALGAGTIEAATEVIPLHRLAKIAKGATGRRVLSNILTQAGIEGTEEAVAYLGNYAADWAAKDPNRELSLAGLAENALAGAMLGGVFGGVASIAGSPARGGSNVPEAVSAPAALPPGRLAALPEGVRNTEPIPPGSPLAEAAADVAQQRSGQGMPDGVRQQMTRVRERLAQQRAAQAPSAPIQTPPQEVQAMREPGRRETPSRRLSFSASERDILARNISALGRNGQNAILSSYREGSDLSAYRRGFQSVYDQALTGTADEDIRVPSSLDVLQAKAAVDAGRNDRAINLEQERQKAENAKVAKKGGLRDYDQIAQVVGKDQAKTLNEVGRMLGREIRYVSAQEMENPRAQGEERADGIIQINRDYETVTGDAPDAVRWIMGHELFHTMKRISPEHARSFQDAIMQDEENQRRVDAVLEAYQISGAEISRDEVMEEIAADLSGDIFNEESDFLERFIQRNRSNQNVLTRLWQAIKDFAARLTGKRKQRANEAMTLLENAMDETARRAKDLPGADATDRNVGNKARQSFAGRNARTANVQRLQGAKELEQNGRDNESIRQETGWHKGRDGKWRFEIDDSQMQYFPDGDARFRQAHPEYAEYQELYQKLFDGTLTDAEQTRLEKLEDLWGNELGRLSGRVERGEATLDNIIQHEALFEAYPDLKNVRVYFVAPYAQHSLASYSPKYDRISIQRELRNDPEKLKHTLIHEIQHAIQQREGFSSGASVQHWMQSGVEEEESARDYYRRTAGEIEARDVQDRMRYNARVRRQLSPDLGGEDTVFADGGGTSALIQTDGKNRQYVKADRQVIHSEDPTQWGKEYDGIQYENQFEAADPGWDNDLSYIAFSSDQLKYADPVTYDDNGEVIPLSQRFQTEDPDIRYSIKSPGVTGQDAAALARENRELREKLEHWKAQVKRTDRRDVDSKSLRQLARRLRKDYSTDMDADEIAGRLGEIYNGITHDMEYGEAQDLAQRLAGDMIAQARETEDYLYHEYEPMRKYFRETPVVLSPEDTGQITDYNDFRKAMFGRLRLRSGAQSNVDQVYQELSTLWPEWFDERRESTSLDQVERIAQVLDEIYSRDEANPYAGDMSGPANFLASEIMESFWDVPTVKKTFADRQQERVDRQIERGNRIRERYQEALRKVREQRDRKIRQEQQKRWAAVDALRQDRDRKVGAEREKRREQKEQLQTRQKERELRARIIRHSRDLSGKLLRPSDAKHIPQQLRTAVASVLESINLESVYTYDPETGRRSKTPNGTPAKRTQAFQELRLAYEAIRREGEELVLDPDLMDNISAIEGFRDRPITGLNLEELTTIWNTVKAVESSISTANKALGRQRFATIQEASEGLRQALQGRKSKKEFSKAMGAMDKLLNAGMIRPHTYYHGMGETGGALFHMMRRAQDRHISFVDSAEQHMKELRKGINPRKLENGTRTFTFDGTEITLSRAEIMSLYELMKRPEAMEHILIGGTRAEGRAGALGRRTKAEPARLSPEQIGEITNTLTEQEIRFADGVQKYMSDTLAKWGNEASMSVYGYEKFTDPHYFPMQVDRNQVVKDVANDAQAATIAGRGFTKATKPHANNALVIRSIFDVAADHISDMATYAAWLEPMENMKRIYNFTFRNEAGERTGTVKALIENAYGKNGLAYWDRLMEDLNNGIRGTEDNPFNAFVGNYKASAIGANIRVFIQQPTSILRALEEISPADFLAGFAKAKPGTWKKVRQYAPIAIWKDWGYFDANTGREMRSVLFDDDSPLQKAANVMMQPANFMDSVSWSHIWNALEVEAQRKHKELRPNTKEFYETVAERFNEVIDSSQVVDGILQRSQIMRSPDTTTKMATSFMAEPTMTYNMFYRAASDVRNAQSPQARNQAIGKMGRVTFAVVTSLVANAAAQSLVDGLRDEDEDEDYWEKFTQAFTGLTGEEESVKEAVKNAALEGNIGNAFNPAGYLPFAKDLLSIAQGYKVTRMDMDSFSRLAQEAGNVVKALDGKGKRTTENAVISLLAEGSRLLGLPVSNLKRDVLAVYKTWLRGRGQYEALYAVANTLYRLDNSSNANTFLDLAYAARRAGDMGAYEHITRDLMDALGKDAKWLEGKMTDRLAADGELEGIQAKEYQTFTKEVGQIEADRDKDGKAITGSKQKKIIDYIDSLDLSREQKSALFHTQYESDKNNPWA